MPETTQFGSLEMTKFIHPERLRIYHYPDGTTFQVENVTHLHVKRNDDGTHTHRLFCAPECVGPEKTRGRFYYVRPGWHVIEFDHDGWTL